MIDESIRKLSLMLHSGDRPVGGAVLATYVPRWDWRTQAVWSTTVIERSKLQWRTAYVNSRIGAHGAASGTCKLILKITRSVRRTYPAIAQYVAERWPIHTPAHGRAGNLYCTRPRVANQTVPRSTSRKETPIRPPVRRRPRYDTPFAEASSQ